MKLNICKILGEFDGRSGVKYPTDEKSAAFRSQFESFRVFSDTEELWFKEILSVNDYIYICVCVCDLKRE